MSAFVCPRCEIGAMDPAAGEATACWWCSEYVVCYVCLDQSGDKRNCGLKICQKCLAKHLQQKSSPPKEQKFRPGELIDGGGV